MIQKSLLLTLRLIFVMLLPLPALALTQHQPPVALYTPDGGVQYSSTVEYLDAETTLPFRVYVPLVTVTAPDSKAWKTYLTYQEQYIADRINEIRVENGLPPLEVNAHLNTAAYRHSNDLSENNLTGHIGSDGSTAGDRIYETGYEWSTWGEICAYGYGGDKWRVIKAWVESPPHYDLILRDTYQHMGVGISYNPDSAWGYYYTVDFAVP